MGIVKSTIYSTTASEAMTQLNFSTDFEGDSAAVTIELLQSGKTVDTVTYKLNPENLIAKTSLSHDKISSEGTITLAAKGNAVAFSGIDVWQDVVSFRAENVAVAYR